MFRRDGPGGFEMMGVDGDLLTAAPDPALPLACEITIEAPSTLPEFIAATEAGIEAITDQLGGRIAGTSRTVTTLWVLVHLPSDEHADRFTQVRLPVKASVSVAPSRDPEWTIFERVRPVDMEVQSMHDLRVMAQLHAAGDVGGVRRIEHVVTGLPADRRSAFLAAAHSVGLEAEAAATTGGGGDRIVLHQEGDPADITPDSWTLRLIAERFGAAYDGWGCDVVRPSERRRRWWRR